MRKTRITRIFGHRVLVDGVVKVDLPCCLWVVEGSFDPSMSVCEGREGIQLEDEYYIMRVIRQSEPILYRIDELVCFLFFYVLKKTIMQIEFAHCFSSIQI